MARLFCGLLMFLAFCTSMASANDFKLRLETSGFREKPTNEIEPPNRQLESIEVVARVNQPFFGKSTVGATTVTINGHLEQLNDGRFRVQLRYRRTVETGEFIGGANGAKLPVTKSTNINSTAILDLQKPVELGKEDSAIRTSTRGVELKTLTRSTLTVDRFEPSTN